MKYKVTVYTRRMFVGDITNSTVEVEADTEEDAKSKALKTLYLDSPIASNFVVEVIISPHDFFGYE